MLILAMLLQAQAAKDCYSADADQDIAQCWTDTYDKADKEMNRVWLDTLKAARDADKVFSPTQRRAAASAADDLLSSQRAWLKYRDAQCAVEADYAQGGSLENVIRGECGAKMTQERIKALRDLAEGFREG